MKKSLSLIASFGAFAMASLLALPLTSCGPKKVVNVDAKLASLSFGDMSKYKAVGVQTLDPKQNDNPNMKRARDDEKEGHDAKLVGQLPNGSLEAITFVGDGSVVTQEGLTVTRFIDLGSYYLLEVADSSCEGLDRNSDKNWLESGVEYGGTTKTQGSIKFGKRTYYDEGEEESQRLEKESGLYIVTKSDYKLFSLYSLANSIIEEHNKGCKTSHECHFELFASPADKLYFKAIDVDIAIDCDNNVFGFYELTIDGTLKYERYVEESVLINLGFTNWDWIMNTVFDKDGGFLFPGDGDVEPCYYSKGGAKTSLKRVHKYSITSSGSIGAYCWSDPSDTVFGHIENGRFVNDNQKVQGYMDEYHVTDEEIVFTNKYAPLFARSNGDKIRSNSEFSTRMVDSHRYVKTTYLDDVYALETVVKDFRGLDAVACDLGVFYVQEDKLMKFDYDTEETSEFSQLESGSSYSISKIEEKDGYLHITGYKGFTKFSSYIDDDGNLVETVEPRPTPITGTMYPIN